MMNTAGPPYKSAEQAFLSTLGLEQRLVQRQPGQSFFSQGERADAVFYIQHGRAKLVVLSAAGKEATLMLLYPGDFIGEEALTPSPSLRFATAIAITTCTMVEIRKSAMIRGIHDSQSCSDVFLAFLLRRSMRIQADLIDHLFNSSEKRLARTLLLLAELTNQEEPMPLLPLVTQETLAEMIGTTRSRVNFFMNRFRKLGFIEYKGRIRVNKMLLTSVLEAEHHSFERPG
jgi:CRP/FNR family transcriptional regulator, cyclic AMP receptor protein